MQNDSRKKWPPNLLKFLNTASLCNFTVLLAFSLTYRRHSSYAREQANITLHGVSLVDNIIARGSVVFVVSSTFRTDQVLFSDSNKSPDLSAVQLDDDSTYVAVETTFYGFQGEVGLTLGKFKFTKETH